MWEDLLEDLEVACLDALRGDPPGPAVAARLDRTVKEILQSRGIPGRVEVASTRSGTHVTLWLPKPDRTVDRVVVRLT